jgi:hypothetical protein
MFDDIKITFKSSPVKLYRQQLAPENNNLLFGEPTTQTTAPPRRSEPPVSFKPIWVSPKESTDSNFLSAYKSPITIYQLHSDLQRTNPTNEFDYPLTHHLYEMIIEIGRRFCMPLTKKDISSKTVLDIKKEIDHLEKLQMKFTTIYPIWKQIMRQVLDLVENLELKCKKQNYLELKGMLALQIMNMAISLVILEDNPIRKKINNFLESLSNEMDSIYMYHILLRKQQIMYTALLNEKGRLVSKQEFLRKKINQPTPKRKIAKTLKIEVLSPEMIEEIKKELKATEEQIENVSSKIRSAMADQTTARIANGERITSVFNNLSFSYIDHPDYVASLDWKLCNHSFFDLIQPRNLVGEE